MTTLLVAALPEEAAYLPGALVTGPGKVRAAAGLTHALLTSRPDEVVVLGTAGALRPGLAPVLEVGLVSEHDLDTAAIAALVGTDYGWTARLAPGGAHLATGDRFVSGSEAERLRTAGYDLVDMEGFAYASAARACGIPLRIVKAVSDDAGADAARDWSANVDRCARLLRDWAHAAGLLDG